MMYFIIDITRDEICRSFDSYDDGITYLNLIREDRPQNDFIIAVRIDMM